MWLWLCDCREHPEVSEELCVEMMTRQLAATGKSGLQHQVLSCLVPWMLNLVLSPPLERCALCDPPALLVKHSQAVTLQHCNPLFPDPAGLSQSSLNQ